MPAECQAMRKKATYTFVRFKHVNKETINFTVLFICLLSVFIIVIQQFSTRFASNFGVRPFSWKWHDVLLFWMCTCVFGWYRSVRVISMVCWYYPGVYMCVQWVFVCMFSGGYASVKWKLQHFRSTFYFKVSSCHLRWNAFQKIDLSLSQYTSVTRCHRKS